MAATIVWFRHDLRLRDNPALDAAVKRGEPVIPVVIWSPDEEAPWAPGAASRWWLHHSLEALGKDLPIVIREGNTETELKRLLGETGADAIYFNERFEPRVRERDDRIVGKLGATRFPGITLFNPDTIRNGSGDPYKVFTAFWKKCLTVREPDEPTPAPRKIATPAKMPKSLALDALKLLPTLDWAAEFLNHWTPGEKGGRARLKHFASEGVADYGTGRDRPDRDGVSRLSPHLHFGELSPREVWHAIREHRGNGPSIYLKELGWRDFAHHLLYHFPDLPDTALRPEFRKFPWRRSAKDLKAWHHGRTGFPIVDAGMRQLWETGWMHNRVRMIVGSFLVKDLRLSWHEGAKWFWDTLVDADLANNTLGWQWVGGCGPDAAPYFRVFNPALQEKKYDPHGAYVREYVPEVATDKYPRPMVDHGEARDAALEAFKQIRRAHRAETEGQGE